MLKWPSIGREALQYIEADGERMVASYLEENWEQ